VLLVVVVMSDYLVNWEEGTRTDTSTFFSLLE